MKTEETKEQLKNIFGKLTKDSNSLFYSVEKIIKRENQFMKKTEFFTNFIMKLKNAILFLMKKTKKYLLAHRLLSRKWTLINC